MQENQINDIAKHFGFHSVSTESLTEGLIHKTYKVTSGDGQAMILQQINTSVFTDPEKIIENYQLLYQHLRAHDGIKIPKLIKTTAGHELYEQGGFYWRAFEYIPDSYTENFRSAEKIFSAAQCYGTFVRNLFGMDITKLIPTIPGFHDLNNRYNQFQLAKQLCKPDRMTRSLELISKIEERKYLVDFYNNLTHNPAYRSRPMHHDCKLSNILFNTHSKKAICPIDLDTTMPGYFFSDLGDMVRTMISDSGEDSPSEKIIIRKDLYDAILTGYQSGIGDALTQTELDHNHHSGLIMIYMQAMRFLTDFLSNDAYYKISYPDQNFARAANQLALLEKVEAFLKSDYGYKIR
jgi:Ser/Thr protein kinase RdoA (MazF antagonist)